MARKLPALIPDNSRDVLTGAPAPVGERRIVQEAPINLGAGAVLTSHTKAVEELADFWPMGDPDSGLGASLNDGRVLPRIKHDAFLFPLTDIRGGELAEDESAFELARREWYAACIASAKRLVPVHSVIGQADARWRGRLAHVDAPDRTAWKELLLEPANAAKILKITEGIFEIDWRRLPKDVILKGISIRLKQAEQKHLYTASRLKLVHQRASADVAAISEIYACVAAGDMLAAEKAHKRLKDNANRFTEALAKLEGG